MYRIFIFVSKDKGAFKTYKDNLATSLNTILPLFKGQKTVLDSASFEIFEMSAVFLLSSQ